MKNILKGLTVSSVALLALVGGSSSVFAADDTPIGIATSDQPAVGKSTAEFEVTAKDDNNNNGNGKLTLDKVPDLKFAGTSVKAIATGEVELKLPSDTATDGDEGRKLQVSDFRGDYSGWKLSASLGDFSANVNDKTDNHLKGVKLHLALSNKDVDGKTTSSVTPTAVDLEQGDNDGEVLLKADGDQQGGGENVFAVDTAKTTLTIPQDPNIKATTYQADITWTLANTLKAPDASNGTDTEANN
ncbi:WxL domain-containing protein [Enterococcus canintestini]|uniref:WxL domain-containing protein n=1 Tax=Enterococcus canintestini TaxID=317010 RepID=A0A267HT49_9ENTE|nr:WxL domain-containing protein [Enterococcus canintestini]PAB01539.1 hypothetical protein AKL21_03530 [Enterococcus canintestini]